MADREAVVYKKGIAAARLVSMAGRVTFSYLPEYLDGDLPAVATTLLKSDQPVVLGSGATPTFFSGLLPEGQRLIAMKTRLKTSLDDELGLLLEIGADLIGDVQVLPPGKDPTEPRDVLELAPNSPELDFTEIREQVFGSRASGLPGVQDKVSSKMLNAPIQFRGYEYILKLNPPSVPLAVENEYFFLKLANACGLKTAKFDLVSDSKGEKALRVLRFDRDFQAREVIRLGQEDAAQVMDIYPSEKYSVDFVDASRALVSKCTSPLAAGLELFSQLVFNWLIGNGDAHAKNFSILEGREGDWLIAPSYDLLCTRFYDDRNMALSLKGQTENWSRQLLLDVALELGLTRTIATKVLDHMLKSLAELPDQILSGSLPFPRYLNIEVSGFLKKRAKSLS